MSRYILSIYFITVSIFSFGQTILDSQDDVDRYIDRADGQYIRHLVIVDDDITDLSPLAGKITSVTELEIKYADNITDLGGWEVAVVRNGSVDRVLIYGNNNLESLEGINIQTAKDVFVMYNQSLKDVDIEIDTARSINIEWNSSLESLTGLYDIVLSGRGYWSGPDNNFSGYWKPALGIVENNALIDLSGLKNIETNDIILISRNDQLTNLEGVENIKSTDDIIISYNESLTSINGMDSISCDYLSITANEQLENLQGLNEISFVNLKIERNHSLENLIGFGDIDIKEYRKIEILKNNNLTSFDGFEGIDATELVIDGNTILTTLSGAKFNEIRDVHINNSVVEDYSDLAGFGASDVYIENNPNLLKIINLLEQTETIDTITNKFGDLYIRENPKLLEIEGQGQINSRLDIDVIQNDSLENIDLAIDGQIRFRISNNPNLQYAHFDKGSELTLGFNSEELNVEIDTIYLLRMQGNPQLSSITVNHYIQSIYEFGNILFDGDGQVLSWNIKQGKLPDINGPKVRKLYIENIVSDFNHCYNIESVIYRSNDLAALSYLHAEEVSISNTNSNLEGLPAFLDTKLLTIGGSSLTSLQGLNNQELESIEIKSSKVIEINFVADDSVRCHELKVWSNSSLTQITGLTNLLSEGDTADMEIDFNSQLELVTLGTNAVNYSGELNVHDNRSLSVCCSLVDWKDDLDLKRNDGICSISNETTFRNSCDLPVYIYRDLESDTVELSNSIGNYEFTIPSNSPGNYIIEILNNGNDSVALFSSDITLEEYSSSASNSNSIKYQFSGSQVDWKTKDRMKFHLEGSLNGLPNVLKSFDAVVLPNPILFIDCGEPDYQNFGNVIRNGYRDGQPAYRFNRITLKREAYLADAIDNTVRMNEKYAELKERFSQGNLGIEIDIVAFGEAGLYTRRMINELNLEPNKFITINTPHSGSELVAARRSIDDLSLIYVGLLVEGAALSTNVAGALLEEVVVAIIEDLVNKISDKLLVASKSVLLEPSSDLIQNLNENYFLDQINKHSIVSVYNYEAHPKNNPEVPELIQKQYMMYSYLSAICANATIQSIAGPDNDTFTSKFSASGGLPQDAVTFLEGDHGNLDQSVLRDEIFDLLDNQERHNNFSMEPYSYYEPTLEFNEQVEVCSNMAGFIGGLKVMKDWLVSVNNAGRSYNHSDHEINIEMLVKDTVHISINNIDSLFVITSDLYTTNLSIHETQSSVEVPIETVSDVNPIMINVFGFSKDSIVAYQSVIFQYEVSDTLSVNLPDTLTIEGFVFDTLEYQVYDAISGVDITILGDVKFDSNESVRIIRNGEIIGMDSVETNGEFIYRNDTTILEVQLTDPTYYIQMETDSLLFPENRDTASIAYLFTNIPETYQNDSLLTVEHEIYDFSIRKDSLFAYTNEEIDFEDPQTFTIPMQYHFRGQQGDLNIKVGILDVNESPIMITNRIYIPENLENGFYIGQIKAEDPEENELSYKLIGGNEDDTYQLTQDGRLYVEDSTALDFELSYLDSLQIELSDSVNITNDILEVILWDINEAPFNIILSEDSIIENNDQFELIGTITVEDQDFEDYFYLSVEENEFMIENMELRSNVVFDYENTTVVTATISAIDQGELTLTKVFEIHVVDVEEQVLKSGKNDRIVLYPNPTSSLIYFKSNDQFKMISLFDSKGSFVMETNKSYLNVMNLKPGVYLLSASFENGKIMKFKFIKE